MTPEELAISNSKIQELTAQLGDMHAAMKKFTASARQVIEDPATPPEYVEKARLAVAAVLAEWEVSTARRQQLFAAYDELQDNLRQIAELEERLRSEGEGGHG